MKKRMLPILLMNAFLAVPGSPVVQETGAQQRQAPAVRNMSITGEIAKADHGYIIRGKSPAEVFSILNPRPDLLDAYVRSGKTVRIRVRIVSGDNVEIEKIDGMRYAGRTTPLR